MRNEDVETGHVAHQALTHRKHLVIHCNRMENIVNFIDSISFFLKEIDLQIVKILLKNS